MKTVVELALKAPFELRVIEVTGMNIEGVGVNWDGWIPEIDRDLHAISVIGVSTENYQWMFVQAKLGKNAIKASIIFSHGTIVTEGDSSTTLLSPHIIFRSLESTDKAFVPLAKNSCSVGKPSTRDPRARRRNICISLEQRESRNESCESETLIREREPTNQRSVRRIERSRA